MRFHRVTAIMLRQYYLIRGSFSRFFQLFVWAAVDMVLWGFLTRYLNQVASTGFNFIPALLGAVLLWDFFIRVMQGVTIAFFEDVWSRNFINIFSTPLHLSEYISGLVLSSILSSFIGLTAMLIIVTVFFHLNIFVYGMTIIFFLMALILFGIALGIFGCALVLRFGPAAEWFIWPIPALISPFVGVMYPISTLPSWMSVISRILPPTAIFEELRKIVSGGEVSALTIFWSGAFALGYIFLAYWFFEKVYRRAVRTGLIARYSAENLS